MSFRGKAFALALACGLVQAAPALAEGQSGYLSIATGAGYVLDDAKPELDISWRSGYKLWIFKPHVGALVMSGGNYYGYAGLLTDLYWGRNIVMTLSVAAGGYRHGDLDLGHGLEFRSGIDLAYRFDDTSRLGLGFYHISNASLGDRNPGTESLLLRYSYPLDKLMGRP